MKQPLFTLDDFIVAHPLHEKLVLPSSGILHKIEDDNKFDRATGSLIGMSYQFYYRARAAFRANATKEEIISLIGEKVGYYWSFLENDNPTKVNRDMLIENLDKCVSGLVDEKELDKDTLLGWLSLSIPETYIRTGMNPEKVKKYDLDIFKEFLLFDDLEEDMITSRKIEVEMHGTKYGLFPSGWSKSGTVYAFSTGKTPSFLRKELKRASYLSLLLRSVGEEINKVKLINPAYPVIFNYRLEELIPSLGVIAREDRVLKRF